MSAYKPLQERLMEKLMDRDGCWVWTGATRNNGYGVISETRTTRLESVHRVAYSIFKGPIPEGLQIDHLCMNRLCCNPDHLEAVTQVENIRRENAHRWSGCNHCKRGHEFTRENTGWQRKPKGTFRYCRACHNARNRARRRGMTLEQYALLLNHGQPLRPEAEEAEK